MLRINTLTYILHYKKCNCLFKKPQKIFSKKNCHVQYLNLYSVLVRNIVTHACHLSN